MHCLGDPKHAEQATRSKRLCQEWATEPQDKLATQLGRTEAEKVPIKIQKQSPKNLVNRCAKIPPESPICLASAGQICEYRVGRSARNETWELCCGSGHLAAALGKAGFKSHGVDLDVSKFHFEVDGDWKQSSGVSFHAWDLLDDGVVDRFCFQLAQGRTLYLHIGLDCASFSILRTRSRTTSRTKQHPWGHENFSGEAAGNRFAKNAVKIIEVCNLWGIQWTIENPPTPPDFGICHPYENLKEKRIQKLQSSISANSI